jgi:putative membrane protein
MKKSELIDSFYTPNRQSPAALLLILVKLFQRIFRQGWPFLLVLFLNPQRGSSTIAIMIVAIAVFSAANSLLSYFRFSYYIEDDEFIIEKGVLRRTRLNVAFDRIQTIEFQQNIVHRIFNVVEVEIDTAGSKGQEFSIEALDYPTAEALRDFLLEKRGDAPLDSEDPQTERAKEETLLHLSIGDLMKVGVSQNHLRTAAILFGLGFSFIDDIDEAFDESVYDMVTEWLGISGLGTILPLVLFFLILSFFASMIFTVFRYFNLRFIRTMAGFKVKSGLLSRREQSATLNKIQFIRWTNNPIKRFFKMYTLRLYQAASEAVNSKRAIVVQGSYQEQIDAVRQVHFPAFADEYSEVNSISPLYVRRRLLFTGIIPTIALLLLGYFIWDLKANTLWFLWWIPIAQWLSVQAYRNWKFRVSEKGMLSKSGIFAKEHTLLQWHKVQSVQLSQSLYQKRRKVADVIFFTAAGSVRIPYVSLPQAQKVAGLFAVLCGGFEIGLDVENNCYSTNINRLPDWNKTACFNGIKINSGRIIRKLQIEAFSLPFDHFQ